MKPREVFTLRLQELSEQHVGMIRRSLVDLILVDKHPYWDVEVLEQAISNQGIAAVLNELRSQAVVPFSTRVLGDALESVAFQLQEWTEGSLRQRFLILWREKCRQFHWEEMRRQTEGLLFDFRLSSLLRQVQLQAYPKKRTDIERIGLLSSKNGAWLLDVSRSGIRTWDGQEGQEGPFWSTESSILSVIPEEKSDVLIFTTSGLIVRWNIDFQVDTILVEHSVGFQGITARNASIAAWVDHRLMIWDNQGHLRYSFNARFKNTPELAISADGQRLIACDGHILGVWSIFSGTVIYGLSEFGGHAVDDLELVRAILDMAQSNKGLRLMDRLGLWGLNLNTQYEILRALSEPMTISDDDCFVVVGEDNDLALLEWDDNEENFVILSHLQVPKLWNISNMQNITSDCQYVIAFSNQSLVAWDLINQKEARYPIEEPFLSKLTVLPNSRWICLDDGHNLSIFQFHAD